jgi:drug/metabolite transporter (DMT)-like permease
MVWVGLFLGIIACSSSVIFIKSTAMDPAYLAGLRLLMASLLLAPWFLRDCRRIPDVRFSRLWLNSLPAGGFLAAHFISWNEGVRLTLAAHGTLIVNMVPVALPFLLWLTHRERVNRVEIAATTVSMLGIAILAINDYHFSREYMVGDLTCFVSMILFAAYLSLGRKNRSSQSIFLYIVPVYLSAAVVCLAVSLWRFDELLENGPRDYLMAFLLALIPGAIGHTLINNAMRHLRGQIVGVMNVSQFLFAGVLAFWIFGEVPHAVFFLVSLFIVASCVVAILSHRRPVNCPAAGPSVRRNPGG